MARSHTDDTLNIGHYISVLLRSVSLHFVRAMRKAAFQQNNAGPWAIGNFRIFLKRKNVDCYPGLHILQVTDQHATSSHWLLREGLVTPVTAIDEMLHLVETASIVASIVIQTLYDSIPWHITAMLSTKK